MRRLIYAIALILTAILSYKAWRWISLPPLARGLPANFAEGETVFRNRVQSKFQPGIDESSLVHELKVQGFDPPIVEKDGKYATFSRFSFPCDLTWWVLWHVDQDGRMTDINGAYGGSCL